MAEVQIKIEIQDSRGNIQKRAALAVPDDITRAELLGAVVERYSPLVDERSAVFVNWPPNTPGNGRLVTDGALVIVRPRSSGVRWLEDE